MSFDLSAALSGLAGAETGREEIQYIRLDALESDPGNFYQLSNLPELADNIAMCGLQQPIRVRKSEDAPGKYIIVSGHRRRAALALLAEEDPKWQEVPCIIERDQVSPALQQLRLIYANSATRQLTAAELAEQAEQVETLLYQLKEDGCEFPGRMRDHVAQAVHASKSKLARLNVIRTKLNECWLNAWNGNRLPENTAYNLAQLPAGWQRLIFYCWGDHLKHLYSSRVEEIAKRFDAIEKIICPTTGISCTHKGTMEMTACKDEYSLRCNGVCCLDCGYLINCKKPCPQSQVKQQEQKQAVKKAESEAAQRESERESTYEMLARTVWRREVIARKARGLSVEDIFRTNHSYCDQYHIDKHLASEDGLGTYGEFSELYFGTHVNAKGLLEIIRVADVLGCSVDYLLGRTDRMEIVSDSDTMDTFREVSDSDTIDTAQDVSDSDTEAPLNDGCITGMSPTGHCGAALYCSEDCTCCLQCENPCNARCGWIEEAENGEAPTE